MEKKYAPSTIWIILFVICSVVAIPDDEKAKEKEAVSQPKLFRKNLYKSGFGVKRAEQVKGVKRIQKMNDYSKQYKMVEILLNNLFKVLIRAKVAVVEMGYIPGEEFPEDQDKLDNLGHVLENVALFSDMILRCPDVTHKIYNLRSKKDQEWKVAMNWGFMFSNETDVFEGANAKLLNLAAQELEIIPREESFVNPYRQAEIKAREKEKLKMEEKKKEEQEEKKKKKKKAKKKGPRLGGGSGEL